MPSTGYRKAFILLEANPDVFNELNGLLGASASLVFQDVFTLEEPDFLPHPTLALILVFPDTNNFGSRTNDIEKDRGEYTGSGAQEPVVWFKQTIHNACGLYAVLHALSNGKARDHLKPGSLLSRLLEQCEPLAPAARALALEDSSELEAAHGTVAIKGDSEVPESAEVEVLFHYICFVRSEKDGHVYELDGDWKGPIDTGVELRPEEDLFDPKALRLVKELIYHAGEDINFNILALVHSEGVQS